MKIPFIKKRDAFILSGVFIVSIIGLLFSAFVNNGQKAEISVDGKIIKTVSLNQNSIFKINNAEIQIKGGKIRVLYSPCKDKICIKTGYISKPSQTIVCLPEKLTIRIIGDSKKSDLIVG